MAKGIPLTDDDRWIWLTRLRKQASQLIEEGEATVFLACSALKEIYRDMFRDIELDGVGNVDVHFIYQRVNPNELMARVRTRKNHYMKEFMVKSQLECIEQPKSRERNIQTMQVAGCISDACLSAIEIVETIIASEE
jgi:gluconokinase